MKKVQLTIKFDHEDINKKINKIWEFKELYLMWCIEGSSPADCPEDMLNILRDISAIYSHFLMLQKKMYNQENRLKGYEILFPEVE